MARTSGASQHAQVSAITECDRSGLRGRRNATHEIGECRDFVLARTQCFGIRLESHHVPPTWSSESLRMRVAQVVTVRFGTGRQRPKYCGLVRIDVRECGDRRLSALRTAARALPQHVGKRTVGVEESFGGTLNASVQVQPVAPLRSPGSTTAVEPMLRPSRRSRVATAQHRSPRHRVRVRSKPVGSCRLRSPMQLG